MPCLACLRVFHARHPKTACIQDHATTQKGPRMLTGASIISADRAVRTIPQSMGQLAFQPPATVKLERHEHHTLRYSPLQLGVTQAVPLTDQQALEQDQRVITLRASPRAPNPPLENGRKRRPIHQASILAKASCRPIRSVASRKKGPSKSRRNLPKQYQIQSIMGIPHQYAEVFLKA